MSNSRPTYPGRVFLSLCLIAILAFTLTPFPEATGTKGFNLCIICTARAVTDALENILLFIPLGVALAFRDHRASTSTLFGLLVSLAIELTQFYIPGRYPSIQDVFCNTLGTVVGFGIARSPLGSYLAATLGWCRKTLEMWKRPHPALANRLMGGSVFLCVGVFGLTTWLFSPIFPEGPYSFAGKEMSGGATPLRIGASGDGIGYYKGAIDEVRIYDQARTLREIREDMERPVHIVSPLPPPALVAAYGFEEDGGDRVIDESSNGNDGLLMGAIRASGRFGRALVFNGQSDQVVIPYSPLLDPGTGITLEAWVRPDSIPDTWPTIIQKGGDHYFLYTGPDLIPGGGGTFGGAIEELEVAEAINKEVWSYLAMTYDGSVLRIYVNGRLAASLVRWFQGRIDHMSVGNREVRPGEFADTRWLRHALRTGEVIRLSGITGSTKSNEGPLLDVQNRHRIHIIRLAAHGDDVILQYKTVATVLGLPAPGIRVGGALRDLASESPLRVELSMSPGGRFLNVNGAAYHGLGLTLGMGWTVLLHSEYLPLRLREFFDLAWMAAWAFPVGFWSRPRLSTLGAMVIIGGSLWIFPLTGVLASTPLSQWAATALGFLTGVGVRLKIGADHGVQQEPNQEGLNKS